VLLARSGLTRRGGAIAQELLRADDVGVARVQGKHEAEAAPISPARDHPPLDPHALHHGTSSRALSHTRQTGSVIGVTDDG
jgi:hypothetical protein